MSDVCRRIDKYALNIYHKMPDEMMKEFYEICTLFSSEFDVKLGTGAEATEKKNRVMLMLFSEMESKDLVRMADALMYHAKPILCKKYATGLNH